MADRPRDVGASMRARLLDRARAEPTDFQGLLMCYALERPLYRPSVSPYRERFVLKGALLFATWVDAPFRPTRDLDLLGYGDPDPDPDPIAALFRALCTMPAPDDGVTFDATRLQATPIREAQEYGGIRVRTTATMAGARIPIQVDVGFGDAITPAPVEIDYPTLLDAPSPHLRAYPVQTVVAEKFEVIATLGMANHRLKDFYDLWLIAQTFAFDRTVLETAVRRTFARRGMAGFSPAGTQRSLRHRKSRAMARFSGAGTAGGRAGFSPSSSPACVLFSCRCSMEPRRRNSWGRTGVGLGGRGSLAGGARGPRARRRGR